MESKIEKSACHECSWGDVFTEFASRFITRTGPRCSELSGSVCHRLSQDHAATFPFRILEEVSVRCHQRFLRLFQAPLTRPLFSRSLYFFVAPSFTPATRCSPQLQISAFCIEDSYHCIRSSFGGAHRFVPRADC